MLGLLALVVGTEAVAQQARRVRVMTYNIHHGEPMGGGLDLEGIVEVIRSQDADIVGLQEVDRHWTERSAFGDQVKTLAERLDMYVYWGPLYNLPSQERGRPNREYGLAILSRFPISAGRNFELTRLPSIDTTPGQAVLPGFPMVTLDLGGTPLHVYNTHLDYRPDPALRHQQVDEMLALIAETSGPKVLMGDLNAPPDAAEIAPLRRLLLDVWDVRGTGSGFTYPAGTPVKRIDHIYVTPGIEVESAAVPETVASDHRPVVADLVLQPER